VLVLVKHSLPAIDPAIPAAHWHLGEEGEERCRPLAEHVRAYEPGALISSTEPKAAETARRVAQQLDLTAELDARLREQDRTGVQWLNDKAFRMFIGRAFDCPAEIVFGMESLNAARERFGAAIDERVEATRGSLVVVAHGTVIAAYTEAKAGVDGYALWRRLGLPSLVVLDGPELVELVEHV
jgi:broad specificity phosphatase PhoE